jgi:hypothetical protein
LHIDAHITGVDWKWERLGRWQARIELIIYEQTPDIAEGHAPDEIVDIDTAISERTAFLIGFGDL